MNFTQKILSWYEVNKRELPWRGSRNPYHIWLSEVILQQTQIVQGTAYYLKFVETFPTVFDLAAADERDVLLLWQGLGYYSRARNLHFSAKFIVNDLGGAFPKTYRELLKLKGVGEYTAAAIASLAYDEVQPAIDGNVQRVIARVFGISEPVNAPLGMKLIRAKSEQLISHAHPADYNQAMMDFGATHCTPKKMNCPGCIFQSDCVAFLTNTVDSLPMKLKSGTKENLYIIYLLFLHKKQIIIQKRNEGIWLNMYELPNITTNSKIPSVLIPAAIRSSFALSDSADLIDLNYVVKHSLTHKNLFVEFWAVKLNIEQNIHKAEDLKYRETCDVSNTDLFPKPIVLENFFKSDAFNLFIQNLE